MTTLRGLPVLALAMVVVTPVPASADDPVTWVLEGTSETIPCGTDWYQADAVYRLKYAFDPGAAPIDTFPGVAVYDVTAVELTIDGTPTAVFDPAIVVGNDEPLPSPDSWRVGTDLLTLTMQGPSTIFASTDLPATPPAPSSFDDIYLEDDSCLVTLTDVTHTVFSGPDPDPDPDPVTALGDLASAVEDLIATADATVARELQSMLDALGRAQARGDSDPPDWPGALKAAKKALSHLDNAQAAGLAPDVAEDVQEELLGIAGGLAAGALDDAIEAVVTDLEGSCFDDRDVRLGLLSDALSAIAKAEARAAAEAKSAVDDLRKAFEAATDALVFVPQTTCLSLTAALPSTAREVLSDAADGLRSRPDAPARVQSRIDAAVGALDVAVELDTWTLTSNKKAPSGVTPTAIDAFDAMTFAVAELERGLDDRLATAADETAMREAVEEILAAQRYLVEQLVLGAQDALADDLSAKDVQAGDDGLATIGRSYDRITQASSQASTGDLMGAAGSYTQILIDFTGAGIVIIGDPAGIVIIGDPAG